jgi:hypothetical protein
MSDIIIPDHVRKAYERDPITFDKSGDKWATISDTLGAMIAKSKAEMNKTNNPLNQSHEKTR